MAGSVNKAIIVGNLGRDPESRSMQNGGKVVSFSVATAESWTDKASGERKEKTQWHRIAIFNEKLGEIAERYLKKGSKVYVEGSMESRKYTDKDGGERETFEIVLPRFGGSLTLLGERSGGDDADRGEASGRGNGGGQARGNGASSYGNRSNGNGGGGGGGGYGGRTSGGGAAAGGGWDKSKNTDLDDDIPFRSVPEDLGSLLV
jgi:single-strand DNA-binding protein